VADRESPRDGRFLEIIGNYNPRTEPSTVFVDEARLFHWMQHGAQPSDSVREVLGSLGTWDRWGRLKAGESLEALLEEAKGAFTAVDPRTDRTDKIGGRPSKKTRAKEQAAVVEAPAAESMPGASDRATASPPVRAELPETPVIESSGADVAQDAATSQPGGDEAQGEPAE
jgi:small subunit ribosomal protein S16